KAMTEGFAERSAYRLIAAGEGATNGMDEHLDSDQQGDADRESPKSGNTGPREQLDERNADGAMQARQRSARRADSTTQARSAVRELPELRTVALELLVEVLRPVRELSLRSLERWRAENGGVFHLGVKGRCPAYALKRPSLIPAKYTGKRGDGSDGPYPGGPTL